MKKKKTKKPQLIFTTLTDLSEQLMTSLVTAGMRGMPHHIMVFVTITTVMKLLKMQGVSDEKMTEMFSSCFNAYVKVDQHMNQLFRKGKE